MRTALLTLVAVKTQAQPRWRNRNATNHTVHIQRVPLTVNGLDAADIAIHVLATAHHIPYRVPHHRAGTYDWFVDRLYGSAATWGAQFPELTYVFGGNGKLERDAAERGHETPEGFLPCHVVERGRDWTRSVCGTFAILRFANCTNDYYGSKGPCCRNQESMRWVLNYRPNVKWYLFQDDDMYIRGPALVALLSRYDPDRAMSISGHNNLRGFAPGMWPVYREKGCLSNSQCTFMFPWMQPAAFSRAALRHMAPAIQQSGLTAECTAFGVTHDVGLGILNWMASLPTVILQKQITGTTAGKEDSVAVHSVKRYKGDVTVGGLKGPSGPDGVLRSHVGLHKHYNDFEASVQAGYAAAEVKAANLSGFRSATAVDDETKRLPRGWRVYTPDDCASFNANLSKSTCATNARRGGLDLARPAPGRRLSMSDAGPVFVAL